MLLLLARNLWWHAEDRECEADDRQLILRCGNMGFVRRLLLCGCLAAAQLALSKQADGDGAVRDGMAAGGAVAQLVESMPTGA